MAVAILQLCYDFATRRLMYKKSNSFIYKFVVNCQILHQVVPYEAEAWHAWSQGQYFSKHRFLDICPCAFMQINTMALHLLTQRYLVRLMKIWLRINRLIFKA